MTLGCGGYGGNITSDNISPRHLLNIKRLAYETNPVPVRRDVESSAASALPKAPAPPRVPGGIPAEPLARRIDQFLASRGYVPPGVSVQSVPASSNAPTAEAPVKPTAPPSEPAATPRVERPVEFVCEDDVRAALKAGRKVLIDEKTIVTPSARDLGEYRDRIDAIART